MMWGYYGGLSWIWMGAMTLLFWGAVIGLAVWAVHSFAAPRHTSDAALDTLRKRFASGEISQEEFEKTRRALAELSEA
jgi:putative membrane protein